MGLSYFFIYFSEKVVCLALPVFFQLLEEYLKIFGIRRLNGYFLAIDSGKLYAKSMKGYTLHYRKLFGFFFQVKPTFQRR